MSYNWHLWGFNQLFWFSINLQVICYIWQFEITVLSCQMVCYTEPSGRLSFETVWKRSGTFTPRSQLVNQTLTEVSWETSANIFSKSSVVLCSSLDDVYGALAAYMSLLRSCYQTLASRHICTTSVAASSSSKDADRSDVCSLNPGDMDFYYLPSIIRICL